MQEIPPVASASRLSSASPVKIAAGTALAYMVMCGLYIIYSSRYAAAIANTPSDLRHLETVKGLAFILVTGLLYFSLSLVLFRKIQRQEKVITAQEAALLKTERKIMSAMSYAVIAHDLNNLLMPMQAMVGELREHGRNDAALEAECADIEAGIGNLSQLCKRIASSSSLVLPDRRERIDLHLALPRLVSLARRHPDVLSCRISIGECPALSPQLNRVLLEEALLNLLINAAQAAGSRGQVELRVKPGAGHILLEVHDNGPGVPKDQVECIFDPCYTTKPDGSGIGLLAVKAFATSCQGSVSVGTSPLGGALFQIRIPV